MDFIKRSQEVFDTEIEELEKVKLKISDEMRRLVETVLASTGKVVITGIGKTGIIGRKLAATLASTGTHSVFMNAAEAMHGDLGIVCRGDIIIAISNSGASAELMNIILPLRKIGCPIVAMTGNVRSELALNADIVINIGVEREVGALGLAPTCSTTAALVMCDALAVCLMEAKGFKAENFALYHPGGALGRRLLSSVRSRMNKNVPKVQLQTPFMEMVFQMSKFRQGMTLVFDGEKAVGIVTDGDLRRAIQRFGNVENLTAEQVMTHGFRRVLADTMAQEALEIMDLNKITSLAVVESENADSQIVGILHIHDIFDLKKENK